MGHIPIGISRSPLRLRRESESRRERYCALRRPLEVASQSTLLQTFAPSTYSLAGYDALAPQGSLLAPLGGFHTCELGSGGLPGRSSSPTS